MMTPALNSYFQRQGNPPQIQAQPGGMQQPPLPYNPYNSGIRSAVQSARASLGMDREQQNQALRSGIASFGQNIGNQPRVSGFLQNLGQIGRAALPAIGAYEADEARSLQENNQMANQILAQQAQEQARIAAEEERTWRRNMAERQFAEAQGMHAEQRRHHQVLENFRKEQNSNGVPGAPNPEGIRETGEKGVVEFKGMPFRKLDAVEQRRANDRKTAASDGALAVKEVNNGLEELKKLTKDNFFAPIGGFSGLANKPKDIIGRFSGNSSYTGETASRNDFAAQLGKLTTSLEAIKAGGGKLGQGMYDRLKPFFPSTEDDLPTLEKKMDQITEEVNKYDKAAQLRSRYGISIDAGDIDQLFPRVMMQNEKGELYSVPEYYVEDAIKKKKFKIVEE